MHPFTRPVLRETDIYLEMLMAFNFLEREFKRNMRAKGLSATDVLALPIVVLQSVE